MHFFATHLRRVLSTTVIAAAGCGLVSCVSHQGEPSPLDLAPIEPIEIPTELNIPTCETFDNTSDVSLIHVKVSKDAEGEPPGARTVTWTYNGDVSAVQVTFAIISKTATRRVQFINGKMTANIYSDYDSNHKELMTPIPLTPQEQHVTIPADIGPSFDEGWLAEISVNNVLIGQCITNEF